MEGNGGLNSSGITIKGDEVPLSFRMEPRTENAGQLGGGSTAPPTTSVPASMAVVPAAEVKKKKRGRPRKYAADGSIVALSPMPISASIPLAGDYAGWKSSSKKKQKLEFCSSGQTAHPASGGFTPHMITINPGEDIMMKIISFSQQGSRAICILAANGSISNVTLRQPNSSGGTLTHEGRFEILSLTGSFMPSDNNGFTKSRSGGLSVSLAGPDGRVLGGGLAGILVAAGPVQVVIGSFATGEEHEQKVNKPKYQSHTISFASPITTNHVSDERYNSNLGLPASFRGNNSVPLNSSTHAFKITDPENNSSFPRKDSRE